MCEDCAIKAGLFLLEHSGARRDKISEGGRRIWSTKNCTGGFYSLYSRVASNTFWNVALDVNAMSMGKANV